MASIWSRRRRLIVTLLVLAAIFVVLSVTFPISRWAREPVMTVLTPVLRAVEAVGRWFGRVGSAIAGGGTVAERDALQRRVEALEAKVATLEAERDSVRATADELKEVDDFALTLLPARVVGRDPTSWYETALINVGTGQGVRNGMQVVKGRWYVGRIQETGPGWSRVMLALDARSAVPAVVAGRGTHGLVETTSARTLLFKYLADEPQAQVGDRIVTSRAAATSEAVGLSFVEGFEIGTVALLRGEEHGWQTAVLERPAALEQLSEVLVVIGP